MKIITTAILTLIIITKLFSQQLTKDQVTEDLNLLIQSIETYNPALKHYSPDFNAQAKAIVESVHQDVSLIDAFALFNRIGALSNEGHFRVDANKVFKGLLDNKIKYLPVSVNIVSGKIYVRNIFTEQPQLEPYDEILSINGKPATQILQKLYQHIPSDGSISTYQAHKASRGFAWMYYMFVEQAEVFNITYKSLQSSGEKTLVIPAITRGEQFENLKKKSGDSKDKTKKEKSINDFYELEIGENYAYLQLKSFDFRLVNEYELDSKKFYKQLFQEIKTKQVNHLIIDLRDNTGGRTEFADDMVPYIQQNREDDFLKKSVSWKSKTRKYKFPKKHKLAYEGKIYVLVNGLTFSAAGNLTRYLNEYGNAMIIGEETGARYEGYAAGSSELVELPNSRISVYIPRYHTLFPKSKIQQTRNRGTIPDVEIAATIQDMQANRDKVFEHTLELINKH